MSITICIPVKNPDEKLINSLKIIDLQKQKVLDVILINSGKKIDLQNLKFKNFLLKEILINQSDFGHGRTRNLVLKYSAAEYFIFLTQDAIPTNNLWLDKLISPMKNDKNIVGSFSRHIAHPGHPNFIAVELENHFEFHKNFGYLRCILNKEFYLKNEKYRQNLHFFSNNSSCIRASYFRKYPFPEVEFSEDQIWAKFAVERKKKIFFAYDSVVYHSHYFTGIEMFKRSVDESRAFKKIFNYKIIKNFLHLLKHVFFLSSQRIINNRKNKIYISISNYLLLTNIIYEAFGLFIGSVLSSNSKIFKYLSRDMGIKNAK